MNTAILSPSGGFVGLGFAIPADVAQKVSQQLIARRPIERGWLGATLQDVTPETGEALGLRETNGALVVSVVPAGPAASAGLRPGDVTRGVDGSRAADAAEVTRHVVRNSPGERMRLQVQRGGRSLDLEVRTGARPRNPSFGSGPAGVSRGH